ncbi:MAG: hypothetical protein Q4F76_05495 [Lachnospiraceae bacterium]|nr:hypothetical protein [Lachnospiraceae bacterium]
MAGAGMIMIGAGGLLILVGVSWLVFLLLTGKKRERQMEWKMNERY